MKRTFLMLVVAGALVWSGPSQTATAQTTRRITPSNAFAPGEIWPDISGKPINAHGGGILFHEGTYYWYGESDNNPLARDYAGGQMARDMTVFVDDDRKAYQFYASEDNTTMHVSLLSDDYLRPAGKYRRIFVGRSMEAPAVFKRNGKYYLIASGCTGWAPNAARSAVADSVWGPWTELGNPWEGADAATSFNSQSSYVLPVQGLNDKFIFVADRWISTNLPDSRYIWLPLRFDADGKPKLRWQSN